VCLDLRFEPVLHGAQARFKADVTLVIGQIFLLASDLKRQSALPSDLGRLVLTSLAGVLG
jgi:hypothetical protein